MLASRWSGRPLVRVVTGLFVAVLVTGVLGGVFANRIERRTVEPRVDAVLAGTPQTSRGPFVTRELAVVGTGWRVDATATRAVLSLPERLLPWSLLAVVAAAVVTVLAAARARRRRATDLARERTEQLAATARELEVTNQQLRDADRSKDELLAAISHDLRAPLTVIHGFVELLLAGRSDGPDGRLLLERVEHQTAILTRLTEDLLTASQSRQAAAVATRQLVDVAHVLVTTTASAETGRLLTPTDDVHAWVDPDHLERIVTNLLVNAAKYGRPPIDVSARRVDDVVEVVVRDHGDGLDPDVRGAAFQPFTRIGEQRRDSFGLGLSIARELAERNDGSLDYQPPAGGGASFVLRLPASSPATVELPDAEPDGNGHRHEPPDLLSPLDPV